jgi:hypothetical protein
VRIGDVVSFDAGRIVPLRQGLSVAGIVSGIGEDRGRYVVAVIERAALSCRVAGLTADAIEKAIYALPDGQAGQFTVEPTGILFGKVLAIDNLEREMAIVAFKRTDDQRQFSLLNGRSSW